MCALHADGRRIPELASLDQLLWPGRAPDDPHPAISALAQSLGPGAPWTERDGAAQTSASGHELAAVDLDNLAHDIGAQRLRGEEQIRADAVFGGSEPGDRDCLRIASRASAAV